MGRRGWARTTPGRGPYQPTSYVSGSTASFSYFPHYFQGWSGHHVAQVVYKFIASPSAEQEALTSGRPTSR